VFPGFLRFLVRKGLEMPASKKKRHHTGRIGWLRAAVLGANDGILSTSSLVLGVAAAHGTHGDDRRHRMDIWSSSVKSTDRKLPIKNGRALASTW
jgi:hypothetical protein